MSAVERDVALVVSALLALPIVAVVVFAVLDVVRRTDLPVVRKVAYATLVVLVSPVAVLYLLSRPTSLVRHRDRGRPDWRDDLVALLTARPGAPPVVGRREEELLLERVEARTAAQR